MAQFHMRVSAGDVGAAFDGDLPPGAPLIRSGEFVDRQLLHAMAAEAANRIADEIERQLRAKRTEP